MPKANQGSAQNPEKSKRIEFGLTPEHVDKLNHAHALLRAAKQAHSDAVLRAADAADAAREAAHQLQQQMVGVAADFAVDLDATTSTWNFDTQRACMWREKA
jgi:hypothetical protein